MSKDFLYPFLTELQNENIGVACMQISQSVRTHIRTTGFMLRKEVANELIFPADPVITKEDCYQFEHRSKNIFYNQVIKMGLRVKQVALNANSPLWDSGYHRRLPRQQEHDKVFGNIKNKVVFICPVFDAVPQIISSLICQTHKEWELLLIHDGTNDLSGIVNGYNDERVKYIKRAREAQWGHPHRQWALNEIKAGNLAADADYVCITNADNYYTPVFCEYMIKGFSNGQSAVYCDQIVHSYIAWKIMNCRLQLGFLDCGGVIVKKEVATEIGWPDYSHSSDWTYFNNIIKKYGANSFASVKGCLFIHN